MSDDVHARLAKHLDTLPIPFPATESGVEIKILKRWFTAEEAGIALSMKGYPEPAENIAARAAMDADALSPKLDAMAKKGLIFRIAKGEKRFYNLVPLAEGMWEFHMNSNDEETVKELHTYIDHFFEKGWYGTSTSQHRVIPISRSVAGSMGVMPYDQAEAIIRQQKKISVAPCICRKEQKMLGEGCDHPSEVCMAFGTGAYFYIENGLGREISQEEALGILRGAMDAGLVLQPGNGQKVWNLCMCCGCSCNLLKALKKMDKPAAVAHTSFYAEVLADNCTACGICVERCPMDAMTVGDKAVVNRDRCIGCGVCAGACTLGAVELRQKDGPDRYVPPADVLEMQMKIARERGLL